MVIEDAAPWASFPMTKALEAVLSASSKLRVLPLDLDANSLPQLCSIINNLEDARHCDEYLSISAKPQSSAFLIVYFGIVWSVEHRT